MDAMPSGHVHLCEALCQTVERLYPGTRRFDVATEPSPACRHIPALSLPMALAWIISRNPEEVREVDNDYLAECRHWQEFKLPVDGGTSSRLQSGYELEPAFPATANSLKWRLEKSGEFDGAHTDLWTRLQQGELIAEGVPCSPEMPRAHRRTSPCALGFDVGCLRWNADK